MADLTDFVAVTISEQVPGLSAPGFGTTLLLSYAATWAERVRVYNNLPGVLADWDANSPEALAAGKLFGQTPAPAQMKIGRGALKAIQRFKITVASVLNSTVYAIRARVGLTTVNQVATITSGGGATNDAIVGDLVAALNALTSPNFTAAAAGAVGSQYVQVVGNAAGNWFGLEVLDTNLLSIQQTHADPGVATDLAAIALADNDWYGLLTTYNSQALVDAAAGWAESNEKLYLVASGDTPISSVAESTPATDVGHDVKANSYRRTHVDYHPRPDEFLDAGVQGRFLSKLPGSVIFRLKSISGATPALLTATQRTNCKDKRAGYYYTVGTLAVYAGDSKTGGGQYLDAVRDIDQVVAWLRADLFNLLYQNDKIPYTQDGLDLIEAKIVAVLLRSVRQGIAARNTTTIQMPKIGDVSQGDKDARVVNNVVVTFTLAGGIHKVSLKLQIQT